MNNNYYLTSIDTTLQDKIEKQEEEIKELNTNLKITTITIILLEFAFMFSLLWR